MAKFCRRPFTSLAAEYPRITSVAIVPLALLRYNTDPRLTPVTLEFCREVISQLTAVQNQLSVRLGTNFAFLGDEIYLRAGKQYLSDRTMVNIPQIEDGVGIVRVFHDEFAALIKRLERKKLGRRHHAASTIFTGSLFAPVLQPLIDKLNTRFRTRLSVAAVSNGYFGGDVSVAGIVNWP